MVVSSLFDTRHDPNPLPATSDLAVTVVLPSLIDTALFGLFFCVLLILRVGLRHPQKSRSRVVGQG